MVAFVFPGHFAAGYMIGILQYKVRCAQATTLICILITSPRVPLCWLSVDSQDWEKFVKSAEFASQMPSVMSVPEGPRGLGSVARHGESKSTKNTLNAAKTHFEGMRGSCPEAISFYPDAWGDISLSSATQLLTYAHLAHWLIWDYKKGRW